MSNILSSGIVLLVSLFLLKCLQKLLDMQSNSMFDNLQIHELDLESVKQNDKSLILDDAGVYWYVNDHTRTIHIKSSSAIYSSILSDFDGTSNQQDDMLVQLDIYDECITVVYFIYCPEKTCLKMKERVWEMYKKKGYRKYSMLKIC